MAVIGCAAFAGIFFTLMAYFMVFGIGDDTAALGKSAAPFGDVAVKAGLGWASLVVYFAAMISVFACSLASINAAARLLFSMGRYRFLHRSMGLVHDTHRTPHRAILLCGGLLAVICVAMLPAGLSGRFRLCRYRREFRVRGGVFGAVYRCADGFEEEPGDEDLCTSLLEWWALR